VESLGSNERPEIGFLAGGLIYIRGTGHNGGALAFHLGLRTWLALDFWRYAESPLLCRAPLQCPRQGALSRLLWQWRRPPLPSCWSPGDAGAGSSSAVARLSQSAHELALHLLAAEGGGSRARIAEGEGAAGVDECRAMLRELVAHAKELGREALVSEVAEALGCDGGGGGGASGGTPPESVIGAAASAPARMLAGALRRLGLESQSLRAELCLGD